MVSPFNRVNAGFSQFDHRNTSAFRRPSERRGPLFAMDRPRPLFYAGAAGRFLHLQLDLFAEDLFIPRPAPAGCIRRGTLPPAGGPRPVKAFGSISARISSRVRPNAGSAATRSTRSFSPPLFLDDARRRLGVDAELFMQLLPVAALFDRLHHDVFGRHEGQPPS